MLALVPAPVLLVVVAIISVQFGNALAGSLFETVGPLGAAALRLSLAALILIVVLRPRVRAWHRRTWLGAIALGVALAGMNALIYLAIDRIPLGVAVTIELLGPLAVAVAGTRRARDVLWVVLAGGGVAMLGLGDAGEFDVLGAVLAAGAAMFWALYIVASSRLGAGAVAGADASGEARGVDALAVAMAMGAAIVLPFGAAPAVAAVSVNPVVLAQFAGIALLTSAVPYALEFLALRRMPKRVFGVLSSLGPAVAALAGLIVLGQALSAVQLAAIAAVIIASAGAVASRRREVVPPVD